MKGLTPEQADRLRAALLPMHLRPILEGNDARRLAEFDRPLVERRLLHVQSVRCIDYVDRVWWWKHVTTVTPLGRIALACYDAIVGGTIG